MSKYAFALSTLLSFCLIAVSQNIHAQTITSIAGNGLNGYMGDGGPATNAELYDDYSIATDPFGGVYVAGRGDERVRRVNALGMIYTFAGTGAVGFSGDGGQATAAQIYDPYGVCSDATGNIYISDWGNARIRKVDTSGIITTFAGNGSTGYGGDSGPATAAQLGLPWGVAADKTGNIYISGYYNHCIRKVDVSGTITTYAGIAGVGGGTGDGGAATAATLSEPEFMACDAAGDLYITDWGTQTIRKVNAATGIITTIAGTGTVGFSGDGGPATAAEFHNPAGISVDTLGNVYVSDFYNSRVRKIDTSGMINTVAGTGIYGYGGDDGPATAAELRYPYDLSVDKSQNIVVCDFNNWLIRKIDNHSDHVTTTTTTGTAITNVHSGQQYSLSPNPNNGNITLQQLIVDPKPVFVEIWSVTGVSIYKHELSFSNGISNIQLKSVAPGTYLLALKDNAGKVEHIKFIVE